MDILVVSIVSAAAGALTLFSGFGLGTLLLPAFALFMPAREAVAATAVVHLANNVFKLFLVGRDADRSVALRFGAPAVVAALAGAALLSRMGGAVNEVMGALIIAFAVLDLAPSLFPASFDRRWLPLGGALSGFLGGLSGHQGALRSAFLIKAGLSRDAFIATGVWVAVMVDVARLSLYGATFLGDTPASIAPLVATACLAAFAGSFGGSRLARKVTLRSVRVVVGVMLVVIGALLAAGMI